MGVFFTSCKTSAKATSTDANKANDKDKDLKQKQRTLVENLFIDGCKEKMAGRLESAENLFNQAGRIDPLDQLLNMNSAMFLD